MSKQIDLRISADTSAAKRDIKPLMEDIKKMSDTKFKVGVETQTVGNSEETTQEGVEYAFNSLEKEFKSLNSVIERLIKTIGNSQDLDKDKNTSQTSSTSPLTQNKTDSNPQTQNRDTGFSPNNENSRTIGDIVSKTIAGIGTVGSVLNYVGKGAGRSAELESEAMRIYNRTGAYGNDFNDARKQAFSIGRLYGYNNQESLYMQSELMQGGFTSKDSLNSDTESIMATSRAYGLDISEVSTGYNQRLKAGVLESGQADQYTQILASSIKQNDMQGRESEQIKALNELVDVFTKGKVEVSSDDLKNVAGWQTVLADLAPELRGERGAQLLESGSSLFNSSDQTMLIAAGYGSDLGYGMEGRWEAMKTVEAAKQYDPEAIQKIMNNLKNKFGLDDTTTMSYIQSMTGMTTAETEKYTQALKNGDIETIRNLGNTTDSDQQALIDNAMSSKAAKNEVYQADKENAQINAGNAYNSLTSPFKSIYSSLPAPLQTMSSVAGGVGMWSLGGKLAGKATNGIGSLFGGIKSGFSDAAKASGVVDDLASGLASGAKTVGASSNTLSNVSRLAPKAGKALGIAGIGIEAVRYGAETIGHLQKGENKEAAGSLGAGVGSIGGGIAGAKAGALLGTAVGGPIGTLLGGVIGGVGGAFLSSKIGRSAGEGTYSLLKGDNVAYADDENQKDKSIVGRKEQILKRSENLLDRMETGDFFKITASENEKEDRTQTVGKSIDTSSNYAQERNQYAQQYANGTLNTVGSSVKLSGDSNKEKIRNYFKKQGFSDAATAGIMGNFAHESGLDPGQHQLGGGPGRGLAQWEGPRWQALQHFAASRGTQWSDLQTQLDFVMEELSTNHSESWLSNFKRMSDVNQATEMFEGVYERSKDKHMDKRISHANDIYGQKGSFDNVSNRPGNVAVDTSNTISSYAVGNDRIDRDQYAYIHKDEAILNKFDAKDYRENKTALQEAPEFSPTEYTSSSNNFNINLQTTINSSDTNATEEIKRMILSGVQQAMQQLQGQGNGFKLNQNYSRKPV